MYIVTFYSFKGGVGRTMALVNMATKLAMNGKRVLIVDFDLEAPGIPTFALTAPPSEAKGLVEYICDYRNSGVAPSVADYVYSAHKFEGEGELLVMPAGLHDSTYSARLNSIDWARLYSQEDGYIFFEDLKSQWSESFSPDYVLIDSRTGHSDVEGICTRQLPDAVCLLFFPNDQNLQGLKRVVANIRSQNERGLQDAIALHFVVSNVPDLDDEEGVIKRVLDNFKHQLGYETVTAEIHHYNSLSLLGQEIFVEKRPKSRLAKEYESLVANVIKENLSDRDVSLRYLENLSRGLNSRFANGRAINVSIKIEKILALFPNDNEISVRVAEIYEGMGLVADALALTPKVDEANAHYYAVRARLNDRLSRDEDSLDDLQRMLHASGADPLSLLQALSLPGQKHLEVFANLSESNAFNSLSFEDKIFIADRLEGGIEVLQAKSDLYKNVLSQKSNADVADEHAMVFIGLGKFEDAVKLIVDGVGSVSELSIEKTFNLAMAELGRDGIPNKDLFYRVVNFSKSSSRDLDANYLACIAIAYAAIDLPDEALAYVEKAQAFLRSRPKREFSPWTFSKVSSAEFLRHLDALKTQIRSGVLKPDFCKNC